MIPLEINGLRKHYGRHQVLRGVDLALASGTVHGLVGLNGAGKTTTLQCILGLLPYDSGEVSVLGLPPAKLHRSRGEVAVVFDEPCLHPHLTVGQILEHACLLTSSSDKQNLRELEILLGIERYHNFKVRELSLGNRRRTSIAQALVGNPDFILLDEPFNGLDAGGVDDLLALIQSLNRDQGISFLLASHQLSYLERICSHMAILHRGQIAVSGDIGSLLQSKQTRLTLLTSDQPQTRRLLRDMVGVTLVPGEEDDSSPIVCDLRDGSSAAINRALVTAGIDVFELTRQRSSLDALFRDVTGELRDVTGGTENGTGGATDD
ncbi:MAG: ABC transporter ATP-binding protein [Cellvibrionaceae bacterium]